MNTPTITWVRGCVKLIDQTQLPNKFTFIYCRDVKTLWHAIKRLSVRGAPAIGIAGAFGVLLAAKTFKGKNQKAFIAHVKKQAKYLATSRPTAVNLFHAIDDMLKVIDENSLASITQLKRFLEDKAFSLYEEDRQVCRAMGRNGARLIRKNQTLMTVCNAGALATVDYGTALGIFYAAKEAKKKFKVFSLETRPLLQGARLTTWELMRAKVDTTLICDNMAASLMQKGEIDGVFTGADRVAANGDSANKIGTYMLAVLAKHHGVPFYIVAPRSTIDMKAKSGKDIPIEQRKPDEVRAFGKRATAPKKVKVYNPAFDVTPAKLITGIVTEKGVLYPPFKSSIKGVM